MATPALSPAGTPAPASPPSAADGRYQALYQELLAVMPQHRLVRDPLRTLVYGTDASFYRLVPQLVVVVESEAEVAALLGGCRRHGTPVTFRAAGTSLSGQAVTDSVLAVLGDGWGRVIVGPAGEKVRLQPGVIGGEANRRLAPHRRKIGPDPASINAAKIGGIAANNASGMCCGTAQNSYRTLAAMRVLLADGTVLDTADPVSREAFAQRQPELVAGLKRLSETTRADPTLAGRIARKFSIKNTTGYSLNALIDFSDPIEILQHLMIGSEGTLGFISEITYHTVPEHAAKASALLLFPGIEPACRAVVALRDAPVSAAELMDRASLRSVEDKPGMPEAIRGLGPDVTALLVETRAENSDALAQQIAAIETALEGHPLLAPAAFTTVPAEFDRLWNIRKGLFPSVGAMRRAGTTVVIEDVAFPIERLAEATLALRRLFEQHDYPEAIIFGHALAGNLHFTITPDFGRPEEVERYRGFMDALCRMVVTEFDGSLKAEHGTGRNIAPFVELEWGAEATRLMHEIKRLFDPDRLLNPGVILNDDPEAHLRNLKPLPAADPLIDRCIECGFCEPQCPSRGLTLTPRQRIAGWREVCRLERAGETAPATVLRDLYDYQAIDTCAACGLCSTVCPVGIDTGALTKQLRGLRRGAAERALGGWLARHYGRVMGVTGLGLGVVAGAVRLTGTAGLLETVSGGLRRLSGNRLPAWNRTMPGGVRFRPGAASASAASPSAVPAGGPARPQVVYLPSCASRTMGPSADETERTALPDRTEALLRKAGYDVIYPAGLDNLCCGMPFESKGLADLADAKAAEVAAALRLASRDGALPILSDTSPCSLRLKLKLEDRLRPLDIVEFIHDHLLPRLTLRRRPLPVAMHVTCSARRMGLAPKLAAILAACSEEVVAPPDVTCCGFAGDKGFVLPELNAHALRSLKQALPPDCHEGYSNSRTCEIGLSRHGGIPYRSIVYLVDACSEAADTAARNG